MSLALVLLLFKLIAAFESALAEEDAIEVVHVIFRHGDRTNLDYLIYPKDPHKNETYQPHGMGMLTSKGVERMRRVGESLGNRYRKVFGNDYDPEGVYARSTDSKRTKDSLKLVLEGIYTDDRDKLWECVHFPKEKDLVLSGDFSAEYEEIYRKYIATPRHQDRLKGYRKTIDYINEHSGLKVDSFQEIQYLYICLRSEEEWGLELPKWTKAVWPEAILKLEILGYHEQTATDEMKTYTSGYFLEKVIEDSQLGSFGGLGRRKAFLYSAHEHNIAHLLINLGVFRPHNPDYGSQVIFEIHSMKNGLNVKVIYRADSDGRFEEVKLPNCDLLCPLDRFVELFGKILPKAHVERSDRFFLASSSAGSSSTFLATISLLAWNLVKVVDA